MWYAKKGRKFPWRKRSASTYEQIIAEVLLQRTKAEAVARYFPDFIRKYPSWSKLSLVPESELGNLLKPLGLWKRRSESLKRLATTMAKRRGQFPLQRVEIESLPGVGQYIANAILLFRFGVNAPLLDVNMARVLERCFGQRKLADIRHDPYLQMLAKDFVSCDRAQQVNWAVLDLGGLVCVARKPLCLECPLFRLCRFAAPLRRLRISKSG